MQYVNFILSIITCLLAFLSLFITIKGIKNHLTLKNIGIACLFLVLSSLRVSVLSLPTTAIFIYCSFVIWTLLGLLTQKFHTKIDYWFETLLSRLFKAPPPTQEDLEEDMNPDLTIKLKFCYITIEIILFWFISLLIIYFSI